MHNLRRLQLRRSALFRASLTTPATASTPQKAAHSQPKQSNK